MSDNWLRFVPTDPWFRPERTAAENARLLLALFLPQGEEVSANFFETVQFIDPGANWSGVSCPSCGADAEPWWEQSVSAAAESGFSSLEVLVPCCGAKLSLNNLSYESPAAFASFTLDALNPNITALSVAQLQELERELGCSIREIRRHL